VGSGSPISWASIYPIRETYSSPSVAAVMAREEGSEVV